MSGAQQAVFQNQRSFIAPIPEIGAAYGGGFFAGQISTSGDGVATHNLVIGPFSTAQDGPAVWKTSNTTTAGTDSDINGPANSAAMNNANHPLAQYFENLTIGGFSDWYMPSKNELEVCYYNLKPGTNSNNTASGANLNAVPSRPSNYTTSVPAQTSATAFRTGGSEAFTSAAYWSSTQFSAENAWVQGFNTSAQINGFTKDTAFRGRAVRRVAV
jgi:hypothetical protein